MDEEIKLPTTSDPARCAAPYGSESARIAAQLRIAADIIEHGLEWEGVRVLHSGREQRVGSHKQYSAFGVTPLVAIEIGYEITADYDQNDEMRDRHLEQTPPKKETSK